MPRQKKVDYSVTPEPDSLDAAFEALRVVTKARYNRTMDKVPNAYIRQWMIPLVCQAFPGKWTEEELELEFDYRTGIRQRPNLELFE